MPKIIFQNIQSNSFQRRLFKLKIDNRVLTVIITAYQKNRKTEKQKDILFYFLVYVDIGNQATDTATLAFTFSTSASTTRMWEIKVSQISCNSPSRYLIFS
jgi:hypothetical protein